MLEIYYRDRAPEYDRFYEIPERQGDLAWLRSWLLGHVRGRTILEVATGTGYWTEVAARVAKAIVATDYNPEMLAIAEKRALGRHVVLSQADAYCLPEFRCAFDAGMAHLWWSHVPKERRQEFLAHFVLRLQPGALVLMIDQMLVEGPSTHISREDEWGNLFTVRQLENGATYEIIKNYPSREELQNGFASVCEDIQVTLLPNFWALSAHVRSR
jgi:SAM-dependent methyltransferase